MESQPILSFFLIFFRRVTLNKLVTSKNDAHDQLLVFFSNQTKIGVSDITEIGSTMKKENVTKGIIISKGTITPLAKQVRDWIKLKNRGSMSFNHTCKFSTLKIKNCL
jgi:hypothetical protein